MDTLIGMSERERRKEYERRVAAIPENQIAWFSGWLCADGSITGWNGSKHASVQFTICDRDPLVKFAELFGNTVHKSQPPSGFGHRPRYGWRVAGFKATVILKRCIPWLSERYLQRAKRAIAATPYERKPRKLTLKNVIAIKKELAKNKKGINRKMAKKYHVSDGMIGHIRCGRIWGDVKPITKGFW